VLVAKHPTPTAVFNLPVVLPFSRKTRSRIIVTGRVALKRNSTSSGVFEPGCVRNERLATTDCVAGSGCIQVRSKALSRIRIFCCVVKEGECPIRGVAVAGGITQNRPSPGGGIVISSINQKRARARGRIELAGRVTA
jgi:hypothetical protein